jgi:hypothetical protein
MPLKCRMRSNCLDVLRSPWLAVPTLVHERKDEGRLAARSSAERDRREACLGSFPAWRLDPVARIVPYEEERKPRNPWVSDPPGPAKLNSRPADLSGEPRPFGLVSPLAFP